MLIGRVAGLALASMCFLSVPAAAQNCPSEVTIDITSIGYSGAFTVELRSGYRPGSEVEDSTTMVAGGRHTFEEVCPGTYFFAIGPEDGEDVSVTNYFQVTFDGRTYNNPSISVFYSSSSNSGQAVGKESRSKL